MRITLVGLVVVLSSCGDERVCPSVPPSRLELAPSRLSDTGLFAMSGAETLGVGVMPYTPRFELWSDGATKRRWIRLPPGTRIDTTDMNFWQFPTGTRVWKEFAVDGQRLETRLLEKVSDAPDDWLAVSYAWNEAQTDAVQAPDGGVDVLGTTHDIPKADQCWGCHGGVPSHVLGFSALQLAHDGGVGEVTLATLQDDGLLTQAPPSSLKLPGTAAEQAALGYLHANCGHCHVQPRAQSTPRCYDPHKKFDLLLRVERLGSVAETPAYQTAIGDIVKRGAPAEANELYQRTSLTAMQGGMPPLAKEVVDARGLAVLREWLSALH